MPPSKWKEDLFQIMTSSLNFHIYTVQCCSERGSLYRILLLFAWQILSDIVPAAPDLRVEEGMQDHYGRDTEYILWSIL